MNHPGQPPGQRGSKVITFWRLPNHSQGLWYALSAHSWNFSQLCASFFGPGPLGPKGGPMVAKERSPKKGTIFIDGPSMNSLMEIHWYSLMEIHWYSLMVSNNEYQWISSSLKSSSLKKPWENHKKTMKNHEQTMKNHEKQWTSTHSTGGLESGSLRWPGNALTRF